jgi:hypothetical protein
MALEATQLSVVPTLEAGCGAAEHDRALLQLRALDGHISRRIPKAILLHIRRVMFLVDND